MTRAIEMGPDALFAALYNTSFVSHSTFAADCWTINLKTFGEAHLTCSTPATPGFEVGTFSGWLIKDGSYAAMNFTDGSSCLGNGGVRRTTAFIACAANGTTNVSDFIEAPTCVYTLTINTPFACGISMIVSSTPSSIGTPSSSFSLSVTMTVTPSASISTSATQTITPSSTASPSSSSDATPTSSPSTSDTPSPSPSSLQQQASASSSPIQTTPTPTPSFTPNFDDDLNSTSHHLNSINADAVGALSSGASAGVAFGVIAALVLFVMVTVKYKSTTHRHSRKFVRTPGHGYISAWFAKTYSVRNPLKILSPVECGDNISSLNQTPMSSSSPQAPTDCAEIGDDESSVTTLHA